jgi:cleavage stimulation factor subunit 3
MQRIFWSKELRLSQKGKRQQHCFLLWVSFKKYIGCSLLLSFTLAELEESRKKDPSEITTIFDSLIESLESEIQSINKRFDDKRAKLLETLTKTNTTNDMIMMEQDGEDRERDREKMKEVEAVLEEKVEVHRRSEVDEMKMAWSLTYIVYMRVMRRSQNIKAARNLFKVARKSGNCTYHVYVSSGNHFFFIFLISFYYILLDGNQ